jgi:hypothetical protein
MRLFLEIKIGTVPSAMQFEENKQLKKFEIISVY